MDLQGGAGLAAIHSQAAGWPAGQPVGLQGLFDPRGQETMGHVTAGQWAQGGRMQRAALGCCKPPNELCRHFNYKCPFNRARPCD